MDKSQRIIKNIIYIAFIFSLLYLFGLVINLNLHIILQLTIVFIGAMLVKFFILNPLVLYGLLTITFISALLVNRYITPIIPPFMEKTYFLFSNIINNLKGKERIISENVMIFWIMLLMVVSIYTAFVLFKDRSIYLLPPVYLGFFLYYWYTFIDQAYGMIFIFISAFVILLGLTKYSTEKRNIDEIRTQDIEKLYSPWVKTAVYYSVLIVGIALILPKSHNYIRWNYLQQKVYTYFPFVEDLRSYNIYSRSSGGASFFDFSKTGFQEESSRLGGPVILSDKKVMTVRGNGVKYLRGNVKHIYTGSKWELEKIVFKDYGLMQKFSGISDEERELYYDISDLIITNHNFASTTLFSPLIPELINFDKSAFVKVNGDFSLVLSQGVYDNESYFIRTLKPLPYGKLIYLGIDNKKDDFTDIEKYLQLPNDKITFRTRNLVNELTHEIENDFEKAKAIEDYLRNNFKYNLKVKIVPENQDFVDYFLFEEKEGYCTYFATSMAIMLRLSNIPSRYIEGYLVQNSLENGVYEVRQENAHAWVEAFIEPVGWMTFEATPAYPIETRLEGYRPAEQIGEIQTGNMIKNDRSKNLKDDLENDIQLDIGVGDWNIIMDDNGNFTTDLFNTILIVLVGIILSIIPIRFILGFILYKYREYKSTKLSSNDRIVYLYNQVLKLVALLGFPQQYGETHNEYARRIAYKFYDYDNVGIIEITEIFVRSKYSTMPSSGEEVQNLVEYRMILEKRVRNSLGKRRYYFYKYISP